MKGAWARLGMLAVMALPTVGVAMSASPASAATTRFVTMQHFAFCVDKQCPSMSGTPTSITIKAGDTIQWIYMDNDPSNPPSCGDFAGQCPGHSTTAVQTGSNGKPLWDSGVQKTDGYTFNYTFNTPGTYKYYCVVHGGSSPNNPVTHMDGTVVVEGASGSSGGTGGTQT